MDKLELVRTHVRKSHELNERAIALHDELDSDTSESLGQESVAALTAAKEIAKRFFPGKRLDELIAPDD